MSLDVFDHYAEKFDEVYEVVKVAEIIHSGQAYRFEVVRNHTNPNVPYTVHTWVEEKIKSKEGDPKRVWVRDVDQPWVACEDAESALSQALGFLADAVGT